MGLPGGRQKGPARGTGGRWARGVVVHLINHPVNDCWYKSIEIQALHAALDSSKNLRRDLMGLPEGQRKGPSRGTLGRWAPMTCGGGAALRSALPAAPRCPL